MIDLGVSIKQNEGERLIFNYINHLILNIPDEIITIISFESSEVAYEPAINRRTIDD
jgi:hypothetical protein